ncbi:MAG: acetyl-CoA hydrolase/transferase C-terminal domain-containing protein [Syntrophomonadaceae bacterium]|nr:acetyl-CoA hydrolase/transferase C-terminal domain-containing protein [Syntrophomonadaceae bacterium]
MRDYYEEYHKKLVNADEAVKVVKSGDWIDYPLVLCAANELEKALSKRKNELRDVKFRSTMSVWPRYCIEADQEGLHFCWNSWHFSNADRRNAPKGLAYYIPMRFSEQVAMTRNIRTDIFMATVSPMDKHGYFSFGAAASASWASIAKARYVILEINRNMPRVLGGNQECIHISQVDMVVESSNQPLPEIIPAQPTSVEITIAEHIINRMKNGSCLQLGIGGIPSAIGSLVAQSDLKDLGVHSEMYVDAFVDMTLAGKISGACKNIDKYKQVFNFAFGSRRMYDFIDDNPGVISYSVDYINSPEVISQNDKVVSINAGLEVDLFGQVCSESIGTRQISGTGGQLDFVEGAYKSRGGQSFLCLPATYASSTGQIVSNIKPTLTPGAIVTDPRTTTHMVVTEFGIGDLKGKSTWERAETLINIAHPLFREGLIKEAQRMNIWRKTNRIY